MGIRKAQAVPEASARSTLEQYKDMKFQACMQSNGVRTIPDTLKEHPLFSNLKRMPHGRRLEQSCQVFAEDQAGAWVEGILQQQQQTATALSATQVRLQTAETNLAEAQAEVTGLQQTVADQTQQLAVLAGEGQSLKAEVARLKASVAQMRRDQKRDRARIEEISASLQQLTASFNEAQDEIILARLEEALAVIKLEDFQNACGATIATLLDEVEKLVIQREMLTCGLEQAGGTPCDLLIMEVVPGNSGSGDACPPINPDDTGEPAMAPLLPPSGSPQIF